MTIAWKEMASGQTITALPTVQYTAPAGTAATIQAVSVYNPGASPVVISLYRVRQGAAADNSTCICRRTVGAGMVIQAHEAINHKLEAGTQLMASGLGLTLNVSGVEYVPGT